MSISSNNKNYYSGGLAEFVSNPTPLTLSFFSYWFTGVGSVGKAMKLLAIPYEKITLPLLETKNEDVFVNVDHEEQTLYKQTIFSYKKQTHEHNTPHLFVNWKKLFYPLAIWNTIHIIKRQAEWIAFPKKSEHLAQTLLNSIHEKEFADIQDLDSYLLETVWPAVIAIGTLCEFYYQFLEKEYKKNSHWQNIQTYINQQIAKDDWFFQSFADQQKVKEHTLSFSEFIHRYGIRADNDYELNSPRWSENEKHLRDRIAQSQSYEKKDTQSLPLNTPYREIIQTYIRLQIIRSDIKKKTLFFITNLRALLCMQAKHEDIAYLTREAILRGDFTPQKSEENRHKNMLTILTSRQNGQGSGVSPGSIQGKILHVHSENEHIPEGSVCVFPNSSPQFSHLYTKCMGIIFLKGGATSHGAIVAREFGVPALIDHNAETIQNNASVYLNGETGEWKIET